MESPSGAILTERLLTSLSTATDGQQKLLQAFITFVFGVFIYLLFLTIQLPEISSAIWRLRRSVSDLLDSMVKHKLPKHQARENGETKQIDIRLIDAAGLGRPLSWRSVPLGFVNTGASCYQNSIINGLASLPAFSNYLNLVHNGLPDSSCNLRKSTSLFRMIKLLNSPTTTGYMFLDSELRTMSSFIQQDAHEYIAKILDHVDRETLKAYTGLKNQGLAALLDNEHAAETSLRKTLSTRNPLEGRTVQRVACLDCGHSEGLMMTAFNCLTLQIGQRPVYDIALCLDEFAKLELINDVHCPKCSILKLKHHLEQITSIRNLNGSAGGVQQRLQLCNDILKNGDFSDDVIVEKARIPKNLWIKTTKSKQTLIGQPPKNLILHINRSIYSPYINQMIKNCAEITFPFDLDLGPWTLDANNLSEVVKGVSDAHLDNPNLQDMLPQSPLGPTVKYRLRGVVLHEGSHDRGHYICLRQCAPALEIPLEPTNIDPKLYRKGQFQGWFRANDWWVNPISEEDVMAHVDGDVFMLFYERNDDEATPCTVQSEEKERVEGHSLLKLAIDTPLPSGDDGLVDEMRTTDGSSDGTSDPDSELASRTFTTDDEGVRVGTETPISNFPESPGRESDDIKGSQT